MWGHLSGGWGEFRPLGAGADGEAMAWAGGGNSFYLIFLCELMSP